MAKKATKKKAATANKSSKKSAPAKKKIAKKTSVETKSSPRKSAPTQPQKQLEADNESFDFGLPMAEIREYCKQHFFAIEEAKQRAQTVLDQNREALKTNPHVTGMHVGLRRTNGKIVWPPEYCIRVHVREKFKPDVHPRIAQSIEKSLEGVVVDVLQQNYESLATPATPLPTASPSILVGGIPIANVAVPSNWGTLGFPLFQNSQRVFLTNQHVVGPSSGAQTNVIQPPSIASPSAVIGSVVASRMDNIIDAAVIESNHSRAAINEILGITGHILFGVLLGEDQNGGIAFKIGAASGTTQIFGRIKSANTSVFVDDQRWMDNQIIVDPQLGQTMVTGGDSGSVLLQKVPNPFGGTTDTYEMIGLVHGGTTQGSLVACHIYKVFRAFKLSLFPQ